MARHIGEFKYVLGVGHTSTFIALNALQGRSPGNEYCGLSNGVRFTLSLVSTWDLHESICTHPPALSCKHWKLNGGFCGHFALKTFHLKRLFYQQSSTQLIKQVKKVNSRTNRDTCRSFKCNGIGWKFSSARNCQNTAINAAKQPQAMSHYVTKSVQIPAPL